MLTGPQEFAAIRVAEGKLSIAEMAAEAKVHPRTFLKWKLLPDFQKVVTYHRSKQAQEAARAARLPIADKNRRLADLNHAHQQLMEMQAKYVSTEKFEGFEREIRARLDVLGVWQAAQTAVAAEHYRGINVRMAAVGVMATIIGAAAGMIMHFVGK